MVRWMLAHDLPPERLLRDSFARRTRESMHRAATLFGIGSATLCTQAFHLPRAVFLARKAGLDAIGVEADLRPYRHRARTVARELAATTQAFIETLL